MARRASVVSSPDKQNNTIPENPVMKIEEDKIVSIKEIPDDAKIVEEIEIVPSKTPNPVVKDFEKNYKYRLHKCNEEVSDDISLWEVRDENDNLAVIGQFHLEKAQRLVNKLYKFEKVL